MVYHLIGQIFEVIPKEYRDKKTGEVTRSFVEVTVEQVTTDANGFRVKDVDRVNFDMEYFSELKGAIDKYIAVPYEYITWRDKDTKQMQSMMAVPEGAVFTIYEKNPLEQVKPVSTKTAA